MKLLYYVQSLKDVSGDEFLLFMKVLSKLKICQTVQGRQQLADIVFDQLECGDSEFKVKIQRIFEWGSKS